MKTIGNIIWFLLIGIESALGWWLNDIKKN